jgi:glycosyltransferase involved in cell wall biosynthesis
MPLSVAVVCRSNQATIGPVIAAARLLLARTGQGELIAVDSGSVDATIPMLEGAGARIVRTPWLGHVRTKQLALDEASKGLEGRGWVLCLDSDEPPDEALMTGIARVVASDDPAVSGCRMNRRIWYRGRYLMHAWQPEWRLRLVRPGRAAWTGQDPHDRLEVTDGGRVLDLEGTLRHDSFVTFVEHLSKQVSHAKVAAAGMHRAGERTTAWRMATSPVGAFLKQVVLKGAWRDGYAGWLAAGSTAAGSLMKHMALLELQHAPATSDEAASPARATP